MGLKPRPKRKPTPMCDRPDRDEPKLVCGAPLPCFRHAVLVVISEPVPMTQWRFNRIVERFVDKPILPVCRHSAVTGEKCIDCGDRVEYSTPQPDDPCWDLEALIRIIRGIGLAVALRRYAVYCGDCPDHLFHPEDAL